MAVFVHLRKFRLILLLALTGLFAAQEAAGQFYNGLQTTFGRNRVQYGSFEWTYYSYDEFETYFYLNGRELALFTANYASRQLGELEKKLETSLQDKIQFIIFNNLSDLKQSNIGLISDQTYNTGGITHIIGRKVILYFDGSHKEFERQIRAGIVNVLLNEMMYGGSITSQITSTTLLVLPEWYLKGLVSFLSEGWNTTIDNRVRDGILTGKYQKFNHLLGEEAIYAGHSIWKYIADQYGDNSISDIVYMTRISKNVESGFLFVLGISFSNLVSEWLEHYTDKYTPALERDDYAGIRPILKKPHQDAVFSRIRLSHDGRYAAYTMNELGKYSIWIYDLQTGKKRRIFKAGFKLDEKTDHSYPLLAWYPAGGVLAFMVEARGGIYLYYYNLSQRRYEKIPFFRFEKVVDFSYSHDGKYFVMSAVQKGQSDLYVYNIASRTYEQITSDIYDDLYPRFIENSGKILFSSNRTNDTIRFQSLPDLRQTPENHDLFMYNFASRDPVLRRITNTPLADEIMPLEYDKGYFSYLSDENGIYNRWVGRFDSVISHIDTTIHYRYFTEAIATTDGSRSILDHDVSMHSGKVGEVVFRSGKYWLYLHEALPFDKLDIREAVNTYFREQTIVASKAKEEDEKTSKPGERPVRKRFTTVRENEVVQKPPKTIDIDNYEFDKKAFKHLKINEEDSIDGKREMAKDTIPELIIPKQINYSVQYFINKMVSQIDFAFLNSSYQTFTGTKQPIYLYPGLNALFKVGATDLMEDYRITGGVRLSANFRSNEYLISLANYKNRLDQEMIFHRQTLENEYSGSQYYLLRQQLHEFHYILKWPFNEVMSLRGSAIYRNDNLTYLSISEATLREPDVMVNWAGFKGEFVYDATREISMNIYNGTRYKLFAEYYKMMESPNNELIVVGFDFRNYRKIHRTFIWANRIAGSSSFGKNKLIYYMGGVDNWLFPKFNQATPVADDQGYAYQTLATNMRGFHQNIRNGNSFVVINSELRFPLFRYFANRPLKSDFFNNFQVVGFGDLGTAWTGLDPYSRDNSLFTNIIINGPMTITVEEYRNPLVGGYGLGLRSRMLGYFIRAEWAWGVEDGKVQPSVFYLSLSLDF